MVKTYSGKLNDLPKVTEQANDVAKMQIPKALKHQTLCFKISYNRTIITTSHLQKKKKKKPQWRLRTVKSVNKSQDWLGNIFF